VQKAKMKKFLTFICIVVGLSLFVPTATASGKGRHFKGTIVAYDPGYHSLKQPSFVRNLEVTIADVGRKGSDPTFIKLIFEGFGTQQVAHDVLRGRKPFSVRGTRDTSCDEDHPRLLSEVDSFQGSGTFLLNETHRTQSLDGIAHLKCYRIRIGK
jgi:hypothetical protein